MTDRTYPVVYIDSDVEQAAWIYATFGPDGTWQTVAQTMKTAGDGSVLEVLEIQLADGTIVTVPFMEASSDESLAGEGIDRSGIIEDIMHIAAQFSENNPPSHPGTLPRFPVPAQAYERALVVPMAILAIDNEGHRGLYSPPRQVVLSAGDNSLIGFGDFPGFGEEHWPPARIGDWPPSSLSSLPQQQLQGVIERFNCCWSRVLEAWFSGEREYDDVLREDIRESLRYRQMLDADGFEEIYRVLNPDFQRWLAAAES